MTVVSQHECIVAVVLLAQHCAAHRGSSEMGIRGGSERSAESWGGRVDKALTRDRLGPAIFSLVQVRILPPARIQLCLQ